jgi:nucleotide-binding universal stress UspA family protein
MPAKLPDTDPRRIAVILGMGGLGQPLLEVLRLLLGNDTEIDLQGVFIEDHELQRAAALPFVKELCRLTLSVREFHSVQFERALALRTRTARRAIAELAQHMGVSHTFRNVRGSTIGLLQETAHSADITVFEPLRMFAAAPTSQHLQTRRSQQRIVVAIDDLVTGADALIAAALLAEGEMRRISVLLTAVTQAEHDVLVRMVSKLLPADPARVLLLSEPGVQCLITAARAEGVGMLVLGASEELLKPESLRALREQLRCPICLVRRWDASTNGTTK